MREQRTCDLEVWTARPSDFGATLTSDLQWLLDETELERAARFRHDSDRRAYVLAHALRRCVLAKWLDADPRDLRFSHEPGGRPVLTGAGCGDLYFSHSRSRDVVACAVTRVAPVGIDVEPMRPGAADDAMIRRFVVRRARDACGQDERTSQFYFEWTALEAFWKAQGRGLADGNARIECRRHPRGHFEVWLEGDAQGARARLVPIERSGGACITVAICCADEVSWQLFNGNMQLFSAGAAHEMLSPR